VYDDRWCGLIECDKQLLTSRNVEGSAVFWSNLDSDLQGRRDMLHAGLPALGGEKVGLNIWTDVELDEVRDRGLFGGWSREWYEHIGKVNTELG
jgi:prolyl 4-hydroxylase